MLEILKSLLFGGGGPLGAVAGVAKGIGIVTLAPLAWHWFQGHGNDVVVTFTVSQAAATVAIVLAVVQASHAARP